jgi:hypothetical protein
MAGMTFSGNTMTSPVWAGDFGTRDHILPGGAKLNTAQFLREDAVVVTLNGSAAIGATSITVDALAGAVPSGTLLHFNSGEFIISTSAAAAGATAIAVEAIPTALEDDDTATYTGVGSYTVLSGTLVGRTYAERAAGTAFGPWAANDDEVYLVLYDIPDVTVNNDVDLYRHGSLVKENFLPNFDSWVAGAVTALRANYQTTRGEA